MARSPQQPLGRLGTASVGLGSACGVVEVLCWPWRPFHLSHIQQQSYPAASSSCLSTFQEELDSTDTSVVISSCSLAEARLLLDNFLKASIDKVWGQAGVWVCDRVSCCVPGWKPGGKDLWQLSEHQRFSLRGCRWPRRRPRSACWRGGFGRRTWPAPRRTTPSWTPCGRRPSPTLSCRH